VQQGACDVHAQKREICMLMVADDTVQSCDDDD
jgi:hypothetical protein